MMLMMKTITCFENSCNTTIKIQLHASLKKVFYRWQFETHAEDEGVMVMEVEVEMVVMRKMVAMMVIVSMMMSLVMIMVMMME